MDKISRSKDAAKESENEKQLAINQHVKMERTLEGCEYCVDSKNMLKHLMVSCGTKVYLALPARKSIVKDQCIISTIQHATCVTSIDEDVWEEIMVSTSVKKHHYSLHAGPNTSTNLVSLLWPTGE